MRKNSEGEHTSVDKIQLHNIDPSLRLRSVDCPSAASQWVLEDEDDETYRTPMLRDFQMEYVSEAVSATSASPAIPNAAAPRTYICYVLSIRPSSKRSILIPTAASRAV